MHLSLEFRMFNDFIKLVQDIYRTKEEIYLHEPRFKGNEKKYLLEAVDSTFVSSIGKFVDRFEQSVSEYTGIKYAIATVNGTSALHLALKLSGANKDTEVITQSLTFVATCNAIHYCNAKPIFIDVDKETLGLSPVSLKYFLEEYGEIRDDGYCWNKVSNKRIVACLAMHTFGLPMQSKEVKGICNKYNIRLIEDAAEALGSLYNNKHVGSNCEISVVSFNGNKIITTGGGGMVLTNNKDIFLKARHLSTTSKITHDWSFEHDEIGYNYRLPNLNAALGVAQMEVLPKYIEAKRTIAKQYQDWGDENDMYFIREMAGSSSNYWLNAAITQDLRQRDYMLNITNRNSIMTRPIWKPMHELPMNFDCQKDELINTHWLSERVVNVPSGVNLKK